MKSKIVWAIAISGILFASCSGNKESKGNTDSKKEEASAGIEGVNPAIEAEIKNTFKIIEDGLLPGTAKMGSITEKDKAATPHTNDGKATGYFISSVTNDQISFDRLYTNKSSKPDVLDEITCTAVDKSLEKDNGTGNMNTAAYAALLDKQLGAKGVKDNVSAKGDEYDMVWKTDKMQVTMHTFSNSLTVIIDKKSN